MAGMVRRRVEMRTSDRLASRDVVSSGVMGRLRSSLPHLTPALRRIASFVHERPDVVVFQTVTELAASSASSEGSVIRFCQEMGYRGLQDFKLALAVDLAATAPVLSTPAVPTNTRELKERAVQEMVAGLEETGRLLDDDAIDLAAARILAAEQIDIYGVGASGMAAQYLDLKLMRLGLRCKSYVDPHLAAIGAVALRPDTVAIGVSNSGSSKDTIEAIDTARAAGAFVIAVVNRQLSPLEKRADCVLLGSSSESQLSGGAAMSKASQMLVFEVLFNALIARDRRSLERIRATAAGVVGKSL